MDNLTQMGESASGADLGVVVFPALYFGQPGYGEQGITGLIVRQAPQDGPAARAGIQVGDRLLQIDGNALFSRDDLKDFLTVSRPGSEVNLRFLRDKGEQVTRVELGQATASPSDRAFPWRYAGLAQLAEALKQAEREGRQVLVGLSGSDT